MSWTGAMMSWSKAVMTYLWIMRRWTLIFMAFLTLADSTTEFFIENAVIEDADVDKSYFEFFISIHLTCAWLLLVAILFGWLMELFNQHSMLSVMGETWSMLAVFSIASWPICGLVDNLFFDSMVFMMIPTITIALGILWFCWWIYREAKNDPAYKWASGVMSHGDDLSGLGDKSSSPSKYRFDRTRSSSQARVSEPFSAPQGGSPKPPKEKPKKTVYVVYVRTGAAGMQKYFEADSLAKAEWAADKPRKQGKEVTIMPETK